jgi:hypothetical protein
VITKSQVLSELQFTLGQKERALQANPYDSTSQTHIAILHQVSEFKLMSLLTWYSLDLIASVARRSRSIPRRASANLVTVAEYG